MPIISSQSQSVGHRCRLQAWINHKIMAAFQLWHLKHLEQCFERDFSGAKKWILLLLIATEEQGDDYQNPSLGEKLGKKFRTSDWCAPWIRTLLPRLVRSTKLTAWSLLPDVLKRSSSVSLAKAPAPLWIRCCAHSCTAPLPYQANIIIQEVLCWEMLQKCVNIVTKWCTMHQVLV